MSLSPVTWTVPLCLAVAIAFAWDPFLIIFRRDMDLATQTSVTTMIATSVALTTVTLSFFHLGFVIGSLVFALGIACSAIARLYLRPAISTGLSAVALIACFTITGGLQA